MEETEAKAPKASKASSPKVNSKQLLRDIGAKLPLGIADAAGAFEGAISVRPWRMKEERELAQAKDKLGRKSNLASYVSTVLATMCTRMGPHDFDKAKYEERLVHISQMYMGDVYYAYIWLRIQAIGKDLVMEIECPHCEHKFTWTGDLETIEVIGADSLKDSQWEYQLQNPVKIRGKLVKKLLLGPIRWGVIEEINPRGGMQTLTAKVALIRGAVHGFPEQADKKTKAVPAVMLSESDLDEMYKSDIEGINAALDKNGVGPDMSIESECTKCHKLGRGGIDWSYDSFFGISSQ